MSSNRQPDKPKPGQESVWDYPRPPRIEKTSKRIRVLFNGIVLADTTNAYRILETSHPPSYYIPQEDIQMAYLSKTNRHTICEFKGNATYWTIEVNDKQAPNAGWSYENPASPYQPAKDHICFYANLSYG